MLKFGLICGICWFAATPAFAAWSLDRETDSMGEYFVAYSTDGADIIEVQVLCDPLESAPLSLTIYTGEQTKQKAFSTPGEPVEVKVGKRQFSAMPTTTLVVDGERVLDVAEVDVPQVRDVVRALAIGGDVISHVTIGGETWMVPGYGADEVFQAMSDECARLFK